MTSRERIEATLEGRPPDRVPLLGGFIVAEKHYRGITGATEAEFDADPEAVAIAAYQELGVDALLLLRLPPGREGHWTYRAMDKEGFDAHLERFPAVEDARDWVMARPSPADALTEFNAEAHKIELLAGMRAMQQRLGDMLWLPAQWDVVHPTFEHYNFFGYDTYMELLGLYSDAADRLFGWDVEVKRRIAEIVVEAWAELGLPKLAFIGTDICGKNGPVVSPAFLRKHYWPHVRHAIEPLVEAGFHLVWHADGVIGPIVDDILACGVAGFQGFQWEYGVRLEDLTAKRTAGNEPLTIFAGPSTSSTLPFGTLDDVRREIETILTAADKCRLFILPGNDILPDTPTEHIIAFHRRAAEG